LLSPHQAVEEEINMTQLYTSGKWTVVSGREEEFVALWSEMAEWTSAEIPGSSWAVLLQDHDKPNVFLSVGPWDTVDAIAAWRGSPGFQERVGRIRALLEDFEPGIFDCRAQIGAV
jgi:heme-degrading monooxygenase HmoA